MQDELLDSIDDENSDNDKNKKSKKKKTKSDNKFNIKTIKHLYQDRFDLIKKYGKLLGIIGFVLLLFITLIKTIELQEKRRQTKHIKPKKELPKIELGMESQSWKNVIETKINNIDKNVNIKMFKFTKIITNELNKTLNKINVKLESESNKTKQTLDLLSSDVENLSQEINVLNAKIKANEQKIEAIKTNPKNLSNNNKDTNSKVFNPILLPTTNKEKKDNKKHLTILSSPKKYNNSTQEKNVEEEVFIQNDNLQSTIIDENELKKLNTPKKKKKLKMAMKMGFVDAVLITGVSAPTFNGGAANPKPILLSLVGDAYLANDYKANLDGCMAVATATGNIITSRAEMLITKISCNYKKDGKMYELTMPVKGWVIGSDGQYGVTGLLVDSAGKILSQSMLIGISQGVAQAISQSALQVATNNNDNDNTNVNLSTALKQNTIIGMGNGFSSGFNIILDYYKKIMDAYFPYISVKAGKKVTILFNGGEVATPKEISPINIHQNEVEEDIEDETEIQIENEDF